MKKLDLKTPEEVKIMAESGHKLAEVRSQLVAAAKVGVTTLELDKLAESLILKAGGKPSFKMVPGYRWSTCINVNDVVVHGVPNKYKLKKGDKVGIDVGMFFGGFHTDTSTTVAIETTIHDHFLEVGRQGLKLAIKQAVVGKRIADISAAMEKAVSEAGYSSVRALTGHGVGRLLHEEPAIPCFVVGDYKHSPKIVPGMVLAIENMYNAGGWEVVYKNNDGWTIATADAKISGLFEETVAIYPDGPVILTK